MNFLNFIGFSRPWAFLALIAIPIIILMYMFKQKYVKTIVPSLFLWDRATKMTESSKSFQKLKRSLLLFLHILMACLIVFALAGPYITKTDTLRNYILVIDNSMSMNSVELSKTRLESAKEEAGNIIDGMKPGEFAAIIVMGHEPYIAANATEDKKTLKERLNSIPESFRSSDYEKTKTLINGIKENEEAMVFLFSDKNQDFQGSVFVPIGESIPNMSVTALSYASLSESLTVYARVGGYGYSEKAENELALYIDDEIFDVVDITVESDKETEIYFQNVPLDAKTLTAKLVNGDSLKEDDLRFCCVKNTAPKKIILFTEQNVFLENIFSVLPNVTLYMGEEKDLETQTLSGYSLYIFDGLLPDVMPQDGHILILNPPVSSENQDSERFIDVSEEFLVKSATVVNDKLLGFIDSFNFSIYQSKNIILPEWGEVILEDGSKPLIFSGWTGDGNTGQKVVVMGFDLHNTDLPLKREFPIFMYNLTTFFLPDEVYQGGEISPGEVVELNFLPEASKVSVTAPDGESHLIAPPFPPTAFSGAKSPGLYYMFQETPYGEVKTAFAINYRDFEESDLAVDNVSEEGSILYHEAFTNSGIENILIIILLCLAVLEWWVFYRGI